MKYRSIKEIASRRFSPDMPRGLGTAQENEKRLTDCSNIWSDGGYLRTRPALTPHSSDLASLHSIEYTNIPLTFTDTKILHAGSLYRLAYLTASDGMTYQNYRVFLISATGDAISIGTISFNRLDSATFYTGGELCFFQGKPTNGSGIYALAKRYSKGNYSYAIYEVDAALENWTETSSFYCPTIYINGRGTRYNEAKEANRTYDVSPECPERPNMLCGTFKAYFSTDDFSSAFKLPIACLDRSPITCRFFISPSNYIEWIIREGENTASTIFGVDEVTMHCDRNYGIIFFTSQSGAFSMPSAPQFGPNNLMITATKSNTTGPERIIGCMRCVNFSSRILLYANPNFPSEVYSARSDNPLYFPDTSYISIGGEGEEITRLIQRGDSLIATGIRGIYGVGIKKGGQYIPDIPVEESAEDFDTLYNPDTLSYSVINQDIGCDCPDTLRLCAGAAVWLNSDGEIYMLSKNSDEPEDISVPIKDRLRGYPPSELRLAFAAAFGGRYYLFLPDSTVFVLDYRGEDYTYKIASEPTRAWYVWSLPKAASVISAACDADKLLLCCSSPTGNTQYLARLEYGTDTLLYDGGTTEQIPIKSSFTTPLYRLSDPAALKSIDEVFVAFECNSQLSLKVKGEGECEVLLTGVSSRLRTARILPSIRRCEGAVLEFSAVSPFKISGYAFSYRPLPDVRWVAR